VEFDLVQANEQLANRNKAVSELNREIGTLKMEMEMA
jgi:hypothetical protein